MALTFCPPPSISPNASIISSTKAALTLPPLPKPSPLSAIPALTAAAAGPSHQHQPLLGSFPVPPTKKHLKRVIHPAPPPLPQPSASSSTLVVPDVVVQPPVPKKRKLATSRSNTPSTSRHRSPATRHVSRSSNAPSSDDDFDFHAYNSSAKSLRTRTRSATPKENVIPFGTWEDKTQARCTLSGSWGQMQNVGIRMDGRAGCVTSEEVVRPIIHKYKKYFSNPDDPADTSFDPHPTTYPVVQLEYPNWEAHDRFILLSPIDKDHYHPIVELMDAIYTMVSCYLLPQQQTVFGRLPEKYTSVNAHLRADLSPTSSPTSTVPSTLSPLNPNSTPTTANEFFSEWGPNPRTSGEDILRQLEKAYNTQNGPLFIYSINMINSLIKQSRDKMNHNVRNGWRGVPPPVIKVMLEETYQRTVGPHVKDLGKYPPFSDLVYGELNMPFVSDILFRAGILASSTFLDLGCGVGNCLIQAALQTGCTANGIELNPPPAALGKAQVEEYHKRLRLWSVPSGEVTLLEGNFCESQEVREWIGKADLVLVNNWAFSAELNQKLSLQFLDLREGAKIVSLKPFRRSDFRLTDRTTSSPEAIFRVEEVFFRRGTVSWMAEGGVYYLHTVDRGPLRSYLERDMHGGAVGGEQREMVVGQRRKRKEKERDADGWN